MTLGKLFLFPGHSRSNKLRHIGLPWFNIHAIKFPCPSPLPTELRVRPPSVRLRPLGAHGRSLRRPLGRWQPRVCVRRGERSPARGGGVGASSKSVPRTGVFPPEVLLPSPGKEVIEDDSGKLRPTRKTVTPLAHVGIFLGLNDPLHTT